MSASPPIALVALGANLGDPIQTLEEAMTRLSELSHSSFARSSIWRSSPVDCPPGSPVFYNAAARFQPMPDETPESLLRSLLELERTWGIRKRESENAPRHIDLDLIAFGVERRDSRDLTLPHPRATQRKFVLAPLAEIAGTLRPFDDERDIASLLSALDDPSQSIERI